MTSLLNEYLSIQEDWGGDMPDIKDIDSLQEAFFESFLELPRGLKNDCKKYLFPYLEVLEDVSFVSEDPYFSVLKGVAFEENGLSLGMKEVSKGELFPYSSYNVGPSPYYDERPSFAFSKKPFSYPVFSKEGRPWMSLIPHEIKTMEKAIEECEGEVLTYGLGMGYFAYRASIKEKVKRVTIIESDPSIVSFFQKHLAPSFPQGKIQLIEGDALKFAKDAEKGSYDYLFADIYHDAEDGLPLYIVLKQAEGAAKRSSYWIEKDILVYFRRYLVAYLLEQNDPEIASQGDQPYAEGKDFPSKLFRGIHLYLKGKEIQSEKDIGDLLSDDSLIDIIKHISF